MDIFFLIAQAIVKEINKLCGSANNEQDNQRKNKEKKRGQGGKVGRKFRKGASLKGIEKFDAVADGLSGWKGDTVESIGDYTTHVRLASRFLEQLGALGSRFTEAASHEPPREAEKLEDEKHMEATVKDKILEENASSIAENRHIRKILRLEMEKIAKDSEEGVGNGVLPSASSEAERLCVTPKETNQEVENYPEPLSQIEQKDKLNSNKKDSFDQSLIDSKTEGESQEAVLTMSVGGKDKLSGKDLENVSGANTPQDIGERKDATGKEIDSEVVSAEVVHDSVGNESERSETGDWLVIKDTECRKNDIPTASLQCQEIKSESMKEVFCSVAVQTEGEEREMPKVFHQNSEIKNDLMKEDETLEEVVEKTTDEKIVSDKPPTLEPVQDLDNYLEKQSVLVECDQGTKIGKTEPGKGVEKEEESCKHLAVTGSLEEKEILGGPGQ